MVSESALTLKLLRERDSVKRSAQVWGGLTLVWGVLVGWFAYLGVRTATEGSGPLAAWAAYLVPLAILGGVTLLKGKRLRDIDGELLAATEADQKRG
jgi:hypothetical protein